MHKLEAIVASIPIKDNRQYYDKWRHSNEFDLDAAVKHIREYSLSQVQNYILHKHMEEEGKDPRQNVAVDVLGNIIAMIKALDPEFVDTDSMTNAERVDYFYYGGMAQDRSTMISLVRFANKYRVAPRVLYSGMRSKVERKYQKKGYNIYSLNTPDGYEIEKNIIRESLVMYFEKWLAQVKSREAGSYNVSSDIDTLSNLYLFKDEYEAKLKQLVGQVNVTDDDIIEFIEKRPIFKDDIRFNKASKDPSRLYKIYSSWFASMGAKYRIVPPELRIKSEMSLVDKFNAVLMFIIAEYMEAMHKDKEVEAIIQWGKEHPIEHPESGKLYIDPNLMWAAEHVYFNVFHGSHGAIKWPKTPENYYTTKYYTYMSDPRRKERIGKYLTWAIKNSKIKDLAQSLNKTFNDHNLPDTSGSDLVTVISWHEYDIAGQSTDREWDSCQNIFHGSRRDYVESTIKAGALIAYLCYSTDTDVKMKQQPQPRDHATAIDSLGDKYAKGKKINIQHPIGRVMIKPFIRRGAQQDFDNPNWLLIVSKKYGNFPDDLLNQLQSWLDKNWNDKILAKYSKAYPDDESIDFDAIDGVYKDNDRETYGYTVNLRNN